ELQEALIDRDVAQSQREEAKHELERLRRQFEEYREAAETEMANLREQGSGDSRTTEWEEAYRYLKEEFEKEKSARHGLQLKFDSLKSDKEKLEASNRELLDQNARLEAQCNELRRSEGSASGGSRRQGGEDVRIGGLVIPVEVRRLLTASESARSRAEEELNELKKELAALRAQAKEGMSGSGSKGGPSREAMNDLIEEISNLKELHEQSALQNQLSKANEHINQLYDELEAIKAGPSSQEERNTVDAAVAFYRAMGSNEAGGASTDQMDAATLREERNALLAYAHNLEVELVSLNQIKGPEKEVDQLVQTATNIVASLESTAKDHRGDSDVLSQARDLAQLATEQK
ncbi:unnamed protein product, partial [Symbiodinium sp. KB8]